jgi:putative N6-adenine-specific DNA methylase
MTALAAYAVCTPGLEALVAEELAGLRLEVTGTEHGGVAFATDLVGLYRANLASRIATRILLRVATFRARTFPDLARATAELPWEQYLAPGAPVTVKAASRASRLYILKRIEATVAEAIAARVSTTPGKAPSPRALPLPPPEARGFSPAPSAKTPPPPVPLPWGGGGISPEGRQASSLPPGGGGMGRGGQEQVQIPAQQILVRLQNNQCTVSLDTSGELLHRRGYRLATAKAPLRETLACAVLTLCGWQPEMPLLDPLCGAGTFAIEAARWALGVPPGWDRTFAFQSWPAFDAEVWQAVRDEAAATRRTALPSPITASDRDPGAVRVARDNAARAGVADLVTVDPSDFFDLRPESHPGLVVVNAPYGRRVGHGDLRTLYRRLGRHLRDHYRGWHYGVLCGNATLARATGLASQRRLSLLHGGRHVPLLHGRL